MSIRERLERRRLFLRVHLPVQNAERDARELFDESLVLNLGALEPLEGIRGGRVDERGDDVALPAGVDLLHHRPVRFVDGVGSDGEFGVDWQAARWFFIDGAQRHLAVLAHGERARDRCGAHGEDVRRVPPLHHLIRIVG